MLAFSTSVVLYLHTKPLPNMLPAPFLLFFFLIQVLTAPQGFLITSYFSGVLLDCDRKPYHTAFDGSEWDFFWGWGV